MRLRLLALLLFSFSVAFGQGQNQTVTTWSALQSCVNQSGSNSITCQLVTSGITQVSTPLYVNRSNTVVEGAAAPPYGASGGACSSCSVLQRTDPNLKALIQVGVAAPGGYAYPASNVTISNFIIDGNNSIISQSTIGSDGQPYYRSADFRDLWIDDNGGQTGPVTVQVVNFLNSSANALFFADPNFSVTGCSFLGGTNAAIWGHQNPAFGTSGFSVISNYVSNYEGGAITLTSARSGTISGNQLLHNSFGNIDFGGGGQIYLPNSARNIAITSNTINGVLNPGDNVGESYGIEIDGGAFITAQGNTISNHGQSGYWIGDWGARYVTIGDTINSNAVGGILVSGLNEDFPPGNSPGNLLAMNVSSSNNPGGDIDMEHGSGDLNDLVAPNGLPILCIENLSSTDGPNNQITGPSNTYYTSSSCPALPSPPAYTPPFGSFDTISGPSPYSGTIGVGGWALSSLDVVRVSIFRNAFSWETPTLVW